MQIPAVSLTQPWATMVALGYKTYETRTWTPKYRGLLAIHAAKGFDAEAIAVCRRDPFRRLLIASGYTTPGAIPLGCVLAIVNLVDIVPTELVSPTLPLLEQALGDYTPGRQAWHFSNLAQLKEPVTAKGALNLWHWDAPFEEDQLAELSRTPW